MHVDLTRSLTFCAASAAYKAATYSGVCQAVKATGLTQGLEMKRSDGSHPIERLKSITVETRGTRNGCHLP